ncbi:MAG: HlyD family efflux transporter periplasmic adaptor subunit [Balneolaceae bacterium]|nr:MAG: HlyD family efflux transporter periplasmic adaptor subunit [Balneolaceae bacterium]
MKKSTIGTIAGIILFFAVVLYFTTGTDSAQADILVRPSTGPFVVTVNTSGELRAKNSIEITGPRQARNLGIWQLAIERIVPEGTVVKAGDFVAELDRTETASRIQDVEINLERLRSQVEQAMLDTTLTLSGARDELINLRYAMEERQLVMEQSKFEAPSVQRQAEIDYERSVRNYNQATNNYATRAQQAEARMREVEAELNKEENGYRSLMAVLDQFTIKAPENGMVIYGRDNQGRRRGPGSSISGWNPVVATLPDLTVMESLTYVNEIDIQKVRRGMKVHIGLDADTDKRLTGEVLSVANIGEQRPNSDAKVFEVVVQINESDTTLRPAMTTSNNIVVNTLENALYIPLEAVHTADDISFVFKRTGTRTVRQQVKLGLMNENEVTITEGLTEDDMIYLSTPANPGDLSFVYLEGYLAEEQQNRD